MRETPPLDICCHSMFGVSFEKRKWFVCSKNSNIVKNFRNLKWMFYIWIYFKILLKKISSHYFCLLWKKCNCICLAILQFWEKKAELHNNCEIWSCNSKKKKKLVSAMDQKSYWVYISQFRLFISEFWVSILHFFIYISQLWVYILQLELKKKSFVAEMIVFSVTWPFRNSDMLLVVLNTFFLLWLFKRLDTIYLESIFSGFFDD